MNALLYQKYLTAQYFNFFSIYEVKYLVYHLLSLYEMPPVRIQAFEIQD